MWMLEVIDINSEKKPITMSIFYQNEEDARRVAERYNSDPFSSKRAVVKEAKPEYEKSM